MSCLNATITRIGSGLHASVSLVCSVNMDVINGEAFMVKEGVFLLSDGESFKVVVENEL